MLRNSVDDSGVHELAQRLKARIGWLVAEMSEGSIEREERAVDPILLRTLGEIVKSSERDCFRH